MGSVEFEFQVELLSSNGPRPCSAFSIEARSNHRTIVQERVAFAPFPVANDIGVGDVGRRDGDRVLNEGSRARAARP